MICDVHRFTLLHNKIILSQRNKTTKDKQSVSSENYAFRRQQQIYTGRRLWDGPRRDVKRRKCILARISMKFWTWSKYRMHFLIVRRRNAINTHTDVASMRASVYFRFLWCASFETFAMKARTVIVTRSVVLCRFVGHLIWVLLR